MVCLRSATVTLVFQLRPDVVSRWLSGMNMADWIRSIDLGRRDSDPTT